MSDETTIDLSGASLTIDGSEYEVRSGELVYREEELYHAYDDPNDPTIARSMMDINIEEAIQE